MSIIWNRLKAAMSYPPYGMNCPPRNALPPPPPPKPITTRSMSIDTNKIEVEDTRASEEESCYSCGSRDCGARAPGQGMSWDWREQPNWGRLNNLLRPFGAVIIEVDTDDDQHTIRVGKLNNNR